MLKKESQQNESRLIVRDWRYNKINSEIKLRTLLLEWRFKTPGPNAIEADERSNSYMYLYYHPTSYPNYATRLLSSRLVNKDSRTQRTANS